MNYVEKALFYEAESYQRKTGVVPVMFKMKAKGEDVGEDKEREQETNSGAVLEREGSTM